MAARIGLLGGTFDPIHFGHLAIAEDARTTLSLDRVLFIPAAQQPFKLDRTVTAAAHRLAMVERACADNETFVPSTVELDREGVSYTVTTLETLRAAQLGELFFLLGADALVDLPKWRSVERLLELVHVVAVQRPGVLVDVPPLLQALPALESRLTLLEGPNLTLSSTELRQRAAEGRSLRYLTPGPVVEYIRQHSLYRTGRE